MVTKITSDFSKVDFLSGEIILLDKPSGWSSFRVITKVRKAISVKKVGHSGTLDPMATGLLIIGTGKKTKELITYQNLNKTYEGVITLGKSSPSMDLETEVTEHTLPVNLNDDIIIATRDKFIGEIMQTPPMYSAISLNGKRLYKLARKGKTISRESRKVKIEKFEILNIEIPDIHFRIECSKGTYIRVIAHDFGKAVDTEGILSSLRRTKIGVYKVEDALSVEEFENEMKNIKQLVR
jgi:tRNA pseudouridine55 synthase